MTFEIIVATDKQRGIGIKGELPWHLSTDLKRFAKTTKKTEKEGAKNAVIMGRNTWISLPKMARPLPGRLNIVLSPEDDFTYPEGVLWAESFEEAFKKAEEHGVENIFIIGGGSVYKQAIKRPECAGVYVTEVLGTFDCDTFFPEIDPERFVRKSESEILEEKGLHFRFVKYVEKSLCSR